MSKQELNWTLVKYTFEGDHKVYINTYEGTEQECRSYAKNLTDGRLCLLDPNCHKDAPVASFSAL